MFLRGLGHEVLMAVGVGDDELASAPDELGGGVVAVGVLFDLVLPDDLAVRDAEGLRGFLDAVHVGEGVAFGLVADHDAADGDGACVSAAARREDRGHAEKHEDRHCQRGNFLEHGSCSS